MRCPYCETENRDDRESCYHCGRDLAMLRLIVQRAKVHYNRGVEMAERGRMVEAIGELDHALQLDANLPEARLLLGSLYVRLERPSEARDQWQAALDSQRSSRRAHDYLVGLGANETAFTLLRRARLLMMAGGLICLAGVLAVVGSIMASPSRESRLIDDAWKGYMARDFQASADLLAQARQAGLADEELVRRATVLEEAMLRSLEERLELVDRSAAIGDFAFAAGELERLEGWKLSGEQRAQVERRRARVMRAAERELEELALGSFSAETLARLQRAVLRFDQAFPDSSRGREAMGMYMDKGRQRLSAVLENIGDAGPEDAGARLAEARRLAAVLGPQAQARVATVAESIEQRRRDERLRATMTDAATAVARGDWATARVLLADLDLPADGELRARYDALFSDLRRGETTDAVARVRGALDAGRLREALETADSIAWSFVPGDVAGRLRPQLAAAARQDAIDAYYAAMAQAEAFEDLSLDAAEAAGLLARLDGAEERLPAAIRGAALDDVVFFRVAGYRILGERERSDAWRERLEEAFPGSPYHLVIASWD